jgi:hypothetical protein
MSLEMREMHRANPLIVTALGEAGTGLVPLTVPSIPLALLLGVNEPAPEMTLMTAFSVPP